LVEQDGGRRVGVEAGCGVCRIIDGWRSGASSSDQSKDQSMPKGVGFVVRMLVTVDYSKSIEAERLATKQVVSSGSWAARA